jgi:pimeloyl-ACP methyl ester carboxylesterase
VDDCLALADSWGFALDMVEVPTRVMLGREDTSVPPSHARWLERHLPDVEVTWVEGGHFGPRDEPEMELMAWVGGR